MKNIAVFGMGEVSRSTVLSLAEKFVSSVEGDVRFIIPLTEKQSKSALWVAEWAQVQDHPFNVIVAVEDMDERQDAVFQSAIREWESEEPLKEMLQRTGDGGAIWVAWDDDPTTEAVIAHGLRRGMTAFDLTGGLEEILLDDEDDDEDEDDEPGEEFPTVFVRDEAEPLGDPTSLTQILSAIARIEEKVDRIVSAQLTSGRR